MANNSNNIKKMLEQLYSDRDQFSDAVFSVGSQQIRAHRNILAALSPKFSPSHRVINQPWECPRVYLSTIQRAQCAVGRFECLESLRIKIEPNNFKTQISKLLQVLHKRALTWHMQLVAPSKCVSLSERLPTDWLHLVINSKNSRCSQFPPNTRTDCLGKCVTHTKPLDSSCKTVFLLY